MLIVEDNLYVADVLIDECEMALGAEVMAVETGHMALQFLARSPPTLALVELALPDMSGFEVVRCAANNDVPAIVMSGHPRRCFYARSTGFHILANHFRSSSSRDLRQRSFVKPNRTSRSSKAHMPG
jgi:response regulator RpfG family c-di-GMP phosphodiesterase